MPFLRTQLGPVHRVRLHHQPGTSLCCQSQSTCALEWGPRDGRLQGLLHMMCSPLLNRRPYLLESGRVVCCPVLHLTLSATTRCPVMTQDAIKFQ